MHLKQLAAIVEPRPWWAPFIRISTRLARYQLPVGATAILALTFITVREYRLPSVDEGLSPSVVETKIDTLPGPAVTAVLPEQVSAPQDTAKRASAVAAVAKTDLGNAMNPAGEKATPRQVADMVPMLGGSGDAVADSTAEYSPAARAIAANLAAVKASAPELVQLMERMPGMDNIMNPPERAQAVDPLSRIQSPSDSRRTSRLLASALPVAASYSSNENGDRVVVERVARSLTEDRLYDSVSRFGVKADRVAIKF